MKKPGPVSAAALAIAGIAPIRAVEARLAAPAALSPAELDVWRLTCNSLPGDWFKPDQAPLLTEYCRLVAQSAVVARTLADCDPVTDFARYSKVLRLAGELSGRILALARSMRLTVQSRLHAVTAAGRAASAVPQRTPEEDRAAVLACVADARARRGAT